MPKPDLVFYKTEAGRAVAVAVVEAKGRVVSPAFEKAVLHQLQACAAATSSPWSILVDPRDTKIYRRTDISTPLTTLSTGDVVQATELAGSRVVGERVLLLAVDKWLHELPRRHDILASHPELKELASDLRDGLTSTEEWPPRRR